MTNLKFQKITLIVSQPNFDSLLKNLRKQIALWEKAADGPSEDAEHEAAFALSELAAELLNHLDGGHAE